MTANNKDITFVGADGNAVTSPYITSNVSDVDVVIPVYMTKTIKNVDAEEMKTFKDQVINTCSVYVETFISEHFLNGAVTEDIMLSTLIDQKFLSKNMTNPSDCEMENIVITAKKEEDKTISYQVRCLKSGVYSELKKAS